MKQETIRSVELPNGVVLNTEDIKDLGMKIYQVLFSKLKGHTEVTIMRKDSSLQSILYDYIKLKTQENHENNSSEHSHILSTNSTHSLHSSHDQRISATPVNNLPHLDSPLPIIPTKVQTTN